MVAWGWRCGESLITEKHRKLLVEKEIFFIDCGDDFMAEQMLELENMYFKYVQFTVGQF